MPRATTGEPVFFQETNAAPPKKAPPRLFKRVSGRNSAWTYCSMNRSSPNRPSNSRWKRPDSWRRSRASCASWARAWCPSHRRTWRRRSRTNCPWCCPTSRWNWSDRDCSARKPGLRQKQWRTGRQRPLWKSSSWCFPLVEARSRRTEGSSRESAKALQGANGPQTGRCNVFAMSRELPRGAEG